MKSIVIISVVFMFFIASCTKEKTKNDIIKDNITLKMKQIMKDPASFEFVDMKIKKAFTVKEREQTSNQESLEEVKKLGMSDLESQILKEMDLMQSRSEDDTVVYYVDFTMRGNNSFGAKITTNYSATVLNDEKLTVLNLKQMD